MYLETSFCGGVISMRRRGAHERGIEHRVRIFTEQVEKHLSTHKPTTECIVFERVIDEMSEINGKLKVEDWAAKHLKSLHEYVLSTDSRNGTVVETNEEVNYRKNSEQRKID